MTSETWYADTADADAQQNPLDTILYAYDDSGNLISESDANSSDAYTYDSLDRITSTTENCTDAPTVVLSYQYDGASTQPSLESASIDGVADYQDAYQYDSQGRLIEITQSGVAGGDSSSVSSAVRAP